MFILILTSNDILSINGHTKVNKDENKRIKQLQFKEEDGHEDNENKNDKKSD
jgi:hypothetical protein